MGSNDFCNTGLELGLGLSSSSSDDNNHSKPVKSQSPPQKREPSLNLTLSGETHDLFIHSDDHQHIINVRVNGHLHRQDSAGASSFSNLSVKRERSEDHHLLLHQHQRINSCNKVSDEEDDQDHNGSSNVRKKLRLSKAQSALLEESFKLHSTLNPRQKQELARELKLRPRQIEVWFQNRRARTKLKQTEVDCEFLKKCCENLTEENLRLHKELQQLKALTSSARHHYIQSPQQLCPSCERSLHSHHFTNHPSAAC